ncbi:MAG: 4-(cytidine 5'-diphospho)-2-C-methyl-D-erythritol kinase [Lachnospiraceae bacterium]|nr:4-(cytidine 5'-diphospho)-2-C-methyl-D-erythritol kinase [Lachnospiraceae bacterium]
MEYSGYGKINLGLDVVGKRADGYHDLRMIMQTIQLRDLVDIQTEPSDEVSIEMTCSDESLSCEDDNLCVKAAKLVLDKCSTPVKVTIHLEKNIPIAAGLAGGSADASAVMEGLNDMLNLGLSKEELMEMGVKIGADVPYCIMKGTALAEGIGDKLTELRPMVNYPIVIAKPPEGVSTGFVYGNLDLDNVKHPDIDRIAKAINDGDIIGVTSNMGNVLETVTIRKLPVIDNIKRIMLDYKALGAMMSGSGPTVFGIFPNEHQASKALSFLKKSGLCDRALITYVYNNTH